MLVQYLVVLEVVYQGGWCLGGVTIHEDGNSRYARRLKPCYFPQKLLQRLRIMLNPFREDSPSLFPCAHHHKNCSRQEEREPSSLGHLDDVRAPERKIDN